MRLIDFATLICKKEGKKKQVNIAQVMEILKIIRSLLLVIGIDLYMIIRKGKLKVK